jgi:hypothetical protein
MAMTKPTALTKFLAVIATNDDDSRRVTKAFEQASELCISPLNG